MFLEDPELQYKKSITELIFGEDDEKNLTDAFSFNQSFFSFIQNKDSLTKIGPDNQNNSFLNGTFLKDKEE